MMLKNHNLFGRLLCGLFLLGGLVFVLPSAAYAQPITFGGGGSSPPNITANSTAGGGSTVTSCDPEYMDALEARAWMEAQREIAMNQNLILKPDSVLEYSCFEDFLNHLANASLFSEKGCCGGSGLGDTSLDTALTEVVGDALKGYIDSNFQSKYLGGRSEYDSNISGTIRDGQQPFTCNQMQVVWDAAKCMDFFDETRDHFYDFDWYTKNDPRLKVDGSQCVIPPGFKAGEPLFQDIAFNNKAKFYVLPSENKFPDDTAPYVEDPLSFFTDQIAPYAASSAVGAAASAAGLGGSGKTTVSTCAAPIPTGLCVRRGGGTAEYPDAICPNPGCHYVPAPGAGACNSPPPSNGCKN